MTRKKKMKKMKKHNDALCVELNQTQEKLMIFLKFMSETLDESAEDLINDCREWAGHNRLIEDDEVEAQKLWSIDDVLAELGEE